VPMRTVTLEVPEFLYSAFEHLASVTHQTSEEVMLAVLSGHRPLPVPRQATSLRDRTAVSVGGHIRAITRDDDLLESMLNDLRD